MSEGASNMSEDCGTANIPTTRVQRGGKVIISGELNCHLL